ncbi:MAG TPA: hypothetical protein VJ919_04105 [Tangfeifania sp.]|nr:hypothetical protein [Tangfeifania sp.]
MFVKDADEFTVIVSAATDYNPEIMNYWPADVCNLSHTFNPLSDYVYRFAEKGKTTANFR